MSRKRSSAFFADGESVTLRGIIYLREAKRAMAMDQDMMLKLHDRASLGEVLSDLEMEQLEAWYAETDAQEFLDLGITSQEQESVKALRARLQRQIDTVLSQIMTSLEQIKAITAENNNLRQEVSSLQAMIGLNEAA